MKSKKLISFLCAAALTVSSFAGLAVTASAADGDDLLTLTDFTSSDVVAADATTGLEGKWKPANSKQTVTAEKDDKGTYLKSTIQTGEGSTYDTTYTLATPVSAANYVIEYDTSIHKSNGMGRYGRYNQIAFTSGSPAKDPRNYGAYATQLGTGNTGAETGSAYTSGIASSLNSIWGLDGLVVNDICTNAADAFPSTVANIADDQWVRVQAAVNTTTHKATVTIINAAGTKIVDAQEYDADATSLDAIHLIPGRGDANVSGQGIVCLDNVHIYEGAAKQLSTEGLRGSVEIQYEDAAPVPTAPGKVEKLTLGLAGSDDISKISNNDKGRLIFLGTEAQEFTELETVNLAFPASSDNRSETQWKVATANTDPALGLNDKYLQAVNSTGSSSNRGGRMYFKKDGGVYNVAEREAVVAQFAARLHANGENPAELIFSGDLVASESKGNLASPLAMITTDAEANSAVYDVNNPLTKGGDNVLEVNDNEWVLVNITAYRSEGKTTGAKIAVTTYTDGTANEPVYIFGSADSYSNIQDNTKSGVNNMPYITFRSGNDTDYGASNTKNDIDNIAVYSSTVDPSATPTPTPVPKHEVEITNDGQNVTIESQDEATTKFDGVLIHVHYDSVTNAPESVKSYEAKNIGKTTDAVTVAVPAGDTIYTGDKLMVWNSLEGMVPYGVYTVQSGETPAVKYAITATNPENGTYTVQVDGVNAASAEEGDEVTITATPAQGYELDTITVKDADNADVTVTAGKFTMPAKAVTVTVTFKALPTPKAITKAAATNGSFTVKAAGAEVESALADTVITVTPTADQDYKVGTVTVAPTDSSVNLAVPVTKNNDGTYTFTMPDVAVTVTVTFVDDSTPADPAITGTVAVTGDPIVGSKLTATVTGLNDGKTAKYQWQANTGDAGAYENIADATANELTIPATLVGKTIKVVVTADGTTGSIESTPTAAVTYPAITGTVAVTGTAKVGEKLTATVTGLNEGKTAKYQWQANTGTEGAYENIADATTNELTIPANLVGKTIKVVVTADGTTGSIESTPTEAVAAKTYAVTITEPTGGTLTVKNGTADVTTGAEFAEGTEISVSATPDADHKGGVITVTGADETPITVTGGKFEMPAQAVRISATFTERTVVPFAEGTVTYEANDATPLFRDYSRTTVTIADNAEAADGDKTKVENLAAAGQAGAGYTMYSTDYPATGNAIKVAYDIKPTTSNCWVSLRGSVPGTANRNNDAAGRIFTTGCETSTDHRLKIYNGGDLIVIGESSPSSAIWYHVDATVNMTAKTFDINVYDYSKYNDYAEMTPLYTGTGIAFRDNTVTGLVAMDFASNTNGASMQIDNLYINDPSYEAPKTVTVTAPAATDGTLTASKSAIKTGDEVVITATPKDKRKLTSIKINGTEVATTSPYTYTVPDPAVDITVSAEFARQDVKSVAITGGPKSVKTGTNGTYTVAVTDIADKVLDATADNAAVTWTAAPADTDGAANVTGISFEGNVMTVADDAALGNVVLTASIPTDATATDGEKKTATYNIKIVDKFVYALAATSATTGGGATFTVGSNEAATEVEQDKTVTVVPKAVEGYNVTGVSYTTNLVTTPVDITSTKTIDASTLSTDTETITVAVTYTAIDYTITNANTDDITIKVNGTAGTTAHIGDTITVEPSAATGKKVATVAVTKTTGGDAVSSATSFTMPAADVTVTATVETWDGVYYSQDFSSSTDDTTNNRVDIGGGSWGDTARQAISVLDSGSFKVYARDRNRSKGVYNLTNAVDTSNASTVKLSFDWKTVVNCSNNAKSVANEITFANSAGQALFAIRNNIASTTRSGIQFYATGSANNNTSSNYGTNGYLSGGGAAINITNSSDATIVPTGTASDAVWYHVEATISDTAVNVTLYNADGTTELGTGTMDITGSNLKKDLKSLIFFIDVGSSGTVAADGANDFMNIDNIKLTTPWYEAPTNP